MEAVTEAEPVCDGSFGGPLSLMALVDAFGDVDAALDSSTGGVGRYARDLWSEIGRSLFSEENQIIGH